jgi:hypothetical protein
MNKMNPFWQQNEEKLEDTKGVIRSHKSKKTNEQYIGFIFHILFRGIKK